MIPRTRGCTRHQATHQRTPRVGPARRGNAPSIEPDPEIGAPVGAARAGNGRAHAAAHLRARRMTVEPPKRLYRRLAGNSDTLSDETGRIPGGLPQTSVVNVSLLQTVDKGQFREKIGVLGQDRIRDVLRGLALLLGTDRLEPGTLS